MAPATVSMAALVLVFSAGIAAAQPANDACHKTSIAAQAACEADGKDDRWIAVGNCRNLADAAARQQCIADARDARAEKSQECLDQFDARESLCKAIGEAPYDPVINPANFHSPQETAAQPNPFFPLVPGMQWVYVGGGEKDTVTVTSNTRVILGVTTTEVHDVVADEASQTTLEDTLDWFAQDLEGNVWYFGELAQQFENGRLAGLEGSWTGGVESAKPGIIMEATPKVGDVYRQEFALGNAEDAGEVTSTTGVETVPAASCNDHCLVTRDFSPLEPDVEENKYYMSGVGLILEVDPATGERNELVSFSGS
jgi:hypothetical protein